MEKIVVGLDIGGANIKAVKLIHSKNRYLVEDVVRDYMPIWIKGVEGLRSSLLKTKNRFNLKNQSYFVGICMTAELSDIFSSKEEGVTKIVNIVEEVFEDALDRLYVDIDMSLINASEVYKNPIRVAAANWVASAWLLESIARENRFKNIVFIDIGSTTTTIIPIVDSKTMIRGKTDPEKLAYGELVYVGTLRTDITSLIDKAPFKGLYIGICRERFALVGDANIVLGHIKSEDYTTETANGRSKSVEDAVARLARVICADTSMVTLSEVKEIARYVYEAQIHRIFEALIQIRSWLASMGIDLDNFVAIVAGIGKRIAVEALKRAGFSNIIDIDNILGRSLASVIPAYGVALMVFGKR